MLQAIAILGGWLLMMSQHDRSESLFYCFRIEDQVPQNHLLRFIDRYVSFDFVREKLRASYSETWRPSIDPEVLLRILLLGYLYGITITTASLCTSMPIYLSSRLISCLLEGKIIRAQRSLSLKVKCHSSADLPIFSSDSGFTSSPYTPLNRAALS